MKSLNKRNPKRPTPKDIIIIMPKVKDKERILKAARDRQLVTYKDNFQPKLCRSEGTGTKYLK